MGVDIVPDSIVASNSTPVTPMLDSNALALVGVQETTKNVERNYNITTNITDEMCSLTSAHSPDPHYLELRELGWRTLEGVEGRYYNEFEYTFKEIMNTTLMCHSHSLTSTTLTQLNLTQLA